LYRAAPTLAGLLLLASVPATGLAQDDADDGSTRRNVLDDGYGGKPTEPLEFAFERITPTPRDNRSLEMEVGIRVRSMTIPRSILDTWYRDQDDPEWAWVEGRPKEGGLALGLEYVIKENNQNGIFYVEYVDSAVDDGYWDDTDESYVDGDYLRPSKGLGMIGLGANYAYEGHLVTLDDTGGRLGISLLVGGGLGVGVLAGRLDRWVYDDQGNPSYKRFLDGEEPDSTTGIPRVLPLVDVNTGVRFNVGDRAVFRVEGGVHTMLYWGVTGGVTF